VLYDFGVGSYWQVVCQFESTIETRVGIKRIGGIMTHPTKAVLPLPSAKWYWSLIWRWSGGFVEE